MAVPFGNLALATDTISSAAIPRGILQARAIKEDVFFMEALFQM
jgi:hypothetical protein